MKEYFGFSHIIRSSVLLNLHDVDHQHLILDPFTAPTYLPELDSRLATIYISHIPDRLKFSNSKTPNHEQNRLGVGWATEKTKPGRVRTPTPKGRTIGCGESDQLGRCGTITGRLRHSLPDRRDILIDRAPSSNHSRIETPKVLTHIPRQFCVNFVVCI